MGRVACTDPFVTLSVGAVVCVPEVMPGVGTVVEGGFVVLRRVKTTPIIINPPMRMGMMRIMSLWKYYTPVIGMYE